MLFYFTLITFYSIYFEFSVAYLSNVTNVDDDILTQKCVNGTIYKIDCNTCICNNNELMCSKMACIENGEYKAKLRTKKEKKAYQKAMNIKNQLEDTSDMEFNKLPSLPHYASNCVPSKKYKVDCNVCYCNEDNILICDDKMCIDQITTRQIEAKNKSGKPCVKAYETKCINCKCKNGTSNCVTIENCQPENERLMLAQNRRTERITFDYTKQQCVPNVVYREKCNKCYCQPDKTLLCTRKMCLNYKQVLELEEQRNHLVEQGL